MSFARRGTALYWLARACGVLVMVLLWWAALATGTWWWILGAVFATVDSVGDAIDLWGERSERDRRL